MAIISKKLLTRAAHALTVKKKLLTRVTEKMVKKKLTTRASQGLMVKKKLLTRAATYSEDTLIYLQQREPDPPTPPAPGVNPSGSTQPNSPKYGFEIIITDTIIGSITIPGSKVADAQLSRGRNTACEWSVTFNDTMDRTFSPLNSSSAYYRFLQPDVYAALSDYDYLQAKLNPELYPDPPDQGLNPPKRTWQFRVKIGSDYWYSPQLILIDVSRRSSSNGYQTVFSGTDLTRNLAIQNQTMSSWETTKSSQYKASDVVKTILTTFGVLSYNLNDLVANDYIVRQFHFQGASPIDEIKRILDVPLLFWYFEGGQFVVKQPIQKSAGRYDWKFVDRKNIFELGYKKSTAEIVNEVEVSRTIRGGSEEHEGGEIGKIVVNLKYSRVNPQLQVVETKHCAISNIEFINATDGYWSEGAVGPYTKAQFFVDQVITTYQEDANMAGSLLYWKVKIHGVTAEEEAAGVAMDDVYSKIVNDTASQALYGRWPAAQIIENTLIPNSEWLTIHGTRYLEEERRKLETVDFSTFLFPQLAPGQTVCVTEYGSNLTDQNFFVDNITHNFTSAQTTFSGGKY